jgi:dipeptidyl aminopeptidase/acylaminoacyl peptidase
MRPRHPQITARWTRTAFVLGCGLVLAMPAGAQLAQPASAPAGPSANAARPVAAASAPRALLTPADYGRFESLAASALSPDGRWLAYGVRTVDEHEELRLRALDREDTRVFEWGAAPAFSPDSRWLVWTENVSTEERQRLERDRQPVRTGARLLDLRSNTGTSYERVRARSFDPSGRFLALHGYAPTEPRGKGADLRVVELATGVATVFGNVDSYAWSDTGPLLALVIATGSEDGNGVQLYDAPTGRLRALDQSSSSYRGLTWREDAADLAVLRSVAPVAGDSTAHALLAWRGLDRASPTRFTLDARPQALAAPLTVMGFTAPRWSPDGRRISLGVRPLAERAENAQGGARAEGAPAGAGRGEGAPAAAAGGRGGAAGGGRGGSDLPGVQIWHSQDVLIFPQQSQRAAQFARRTMLVVWSPDDGKLVQVGTDVAETASLTSDWRFGTERITTPYAWGTMFGRSYHDLYVVDLASGQRTRALEKVRYSYLSAGGRYVLSYDGKDYSSLDLRSNARANLTQALGATFTDTSYDTPTDVMPPHGVGGWLKDDAAVLLYDAHDVWRVAPDGSGGDRLTQGAAENVIHRLLTVGQEDGVYGADRPIFLSLRDEDNEQRGFARIPRLGRAPERLALADANLAQLVKADSANVFLYRSEARDVSPNLFVAGPDLANARRVTDTNPFLKDFAWTKSELFHFQSEAGVPLKGVLLYPAGYEAGRQYPMIVYTYELLSNGIHSFQVPSERVYYNYTVWTQQGYFVMMPDIVYRGGDPGPSAVEAVRPAVKAVTARGLVDPRRVGLIGHSWGGYQAAYIPTRTGDLFAASVAGAPLTDFVSFMGQIHWSGGGPELTHWETGQARMEVPYWDDVQSHLRNSPLHEVQNLTAPVLLAHGNEDGTVEFWQSTVFYNYARRAGKNLVLLVYEGENHGFTQKPNQVDYHRRILEWFGHYLKGEPAPDWITRGVAFENLEAEKKRVAQPSATPSATEASGGTAPAPRGPAPAGGPR